MTKAPHPTFAQCLDMMRTGNPQVAEDGFAYLRPRAKDHVAELMAAYAAEANHAMQCWLLELIGETRSDKTLELLKGEARADDGAIRSWAIRGLEKLDSHAARTFLLNNDRASIE